MPVTMQTHLSGFHLWSPTSVLGQDAQLQPASIVSQSHTVSCLGASQSLAATYPGPLKSRSLLYIGTSRASTACSCGPSRHSCSTTLALSAEEKTVRQLLQKLLELQDLQSHDIATMSSSSTL